MMRRDLIKMTPAMVAAGALPASAMQAVNRADTPVTRAYREWEAALKAWNGAAEGDISDAEGDAWCNKIMDLADDVLDQPSTGPLDFIYKLMAQSFHGQHDIGACPRGDELWAEARALVEDAA